MKLLWRLRYYNYSRAPIVLHYNRPTYSRRTQQQRKKKKTLPGLHTTKRHTKNKKKDSVIIQYLEHTQDYGVNCCELYIIKPSLSNLFDKLFIHTYYIIHKIYYSSYGDDE